MKATSNATHESAAKTITQVSDVINLKPEGTNSSNICLYRLPDVLARIPVSRSSWFAGIKLGRYPRGFHLGARTTVWRSDQIDSLIMNLGSAV